MVPCFLRDLPEVDRDTQQRKPPGLEEGCFRDRARSTVGWLQYPVVSFVEHVVDFNLCRVLAACSINLRQQYFESV